MGADLSEEGRKNKKKNKQKCSVDSCEIQRPLFKDGIASPIIEYFFSFYPGSVWIFIVIFILFYFVSLE